MENAPPDKLPRRVTAQDVAKAAGVSRSAVSRAFTDGTYLDAEKRALILATATRLGYRPNALAAGLQGARSNLVAVFVGDLRNTYDKDVVSRLVAGLNAYGKWPIMIDGSSDTARTALSKVLAFPLDALIVRSGSIDPDIVAQCTKLAIPMISSGRVLDFDGVDSVCLRNAEATAIATRLLIERGRRCFGYINGPAGLSSTSERRDGVISALADGPARLIAEEHGDYSVEGGYQATSRLIEAHQLDALICANDAMAIGALQALHEAGQSVPDSLSVIGFDDIEMAAWPAFNLTTMHNPIGAMVSAVIELLDRRLAHPGKEAERIYLDAELILRGSH